MEHTGCKYCGSNQGKILPEATCNGCKEIKDNGVNIVEINYTQAEVIDAVIETDVDKFKRIIKLQNTLVHDLLDTISDAGTKPSPNAADLAEIIKKLKSEIIF